MASEVNNYNFAANFDAMRIELYNQKTTDCQK